MGLLGSVGDLLGMALSHGMPNPIQSLGSGANTPISGLMSASGGLFGGSGAPALGPSMQGGGSLFGGGAGMGGGALPGTTAPVMTSSGPFAGAFGGTGMQFPFSLGSNMGSAMGSMNPQLMQQAMGMMQQGQQHQPQGVSTSPQLSIGNPMMHGAPTSLGPQMAYSTFGSAGGQPSPLAQMLAMRGGM